VQLPLLEEEAFITFKCTYCWRQAYRISIIAWLPVLSISWILGSHASMFEHQGSSEAYFSSISSPARRIIQDVVEIRASVDTTAAGEWRNLTVQDRERLLDERLMDASLAAAPKAQKYHTLGSRGARNKNKGGQEVRLSTFGVDQVFPRLKINTGQKRTVVDDVISNGTSVTSVGRSGRISEALKTT